MNEMTTQQTKCGVVALIGAPNAGKSTLVNALVGSKIAIVTPKVQTTRQSIRGIQIYRTPTEREALVPAQAGSEARSVGSGEDSPVCEAQIIYTDTPGIFNAPEAYEQAMVSTAWNAAGEADVVLVVVDATKNLSPELEVILKKAAHFSKPKILVLNKIDKMPKPKLLALIAWLNQHAAFDETFMVSALNGDGVEELQQWLTSKMPVGEWLFPEDQLSDLPIRFLAAEITRERLFLRLREELPYGLMVETESWEERKDGSVKINQVIIVERDAHKKIVLGKQGEQLKTIGQSARHEISKMLDCPVHLFLFVKVIPDWKTRHEYQPENIVR